MLIFFKNVNDDMNIYKGLLLTQPDSTYSNIYVDATECLSLKYNKPDWKNLHIQSISIQDCICICDNIKLFYKHYPEYLI